MKKLFGFLLLAAAMLVSCEQQELPSSSGKAVRFTTSVGTKTSFAGVTQNGVEGLLWENGDTFTVWSEEASVSGSTQKWANYKVAAKDGVATAVNPAKEGVELLWGKDKHTFYAAYPAGKLNGNVIKAYIPEYQVVKETEDNVFIPVLSEYGYMYAVAQATPEESSVKLPFTPLFNTFEFIVSPGEKTDALVSAFRLEVQNGSKQTLAGNFETTLSPIIEPKVEIDYTNATGVVKLQFGDHRSIKVPKGTTLTFSVITYPVAMGHLTAVFTVDGKEIALPLADKDGNYFKFEPGQKARIRALGALGPEAQAAGITVVLKGQNVNDFDMSVPTP
ncbi:MAG: fimbrillin family protein [Bacteroidales bacterium]|nr:fimbrillin family protein [Bacteroidales bacterium]